MKTTTKNLLLAAGLLSAFSTLADSNVFDFDRGIGSSLPFRTNNNGTPTDPTDDYPEPNNLFANIPGAPVANAAGQVWVIDSFKASIKPDGSISAKGKGLLLGGGANLGTRGGPRQVYASLFLRQAPVAPATTPTITGPYNSAPVDLDANGDFKINGVLKDAAGSTPASLGDKVDNRPILLIRNVANNNWFAAGLLKGDRTH